MEVSRQKNGAETSAFGASSMPRRWRSIDPQKVPASKKEQAHHATVARVRDVADTDRLCFMGSQYFDNRTELVKDDLIRSLHAGDRVAVASSLFSIYAYRELKDQLENLDEFRFLFTSKAFTKDKDSKELREFYIPRLEREQGLYGTNLEIKLRNELTQKHLAHECAEWIRTHNVHFKSINNEISANYLLTNTAADGLSYYFPFPQFSTVQLGIGNHNDNSMGVMKTTDEATQGFLHEFDRLWNDPERVQDVTDAVATGIEQMYRENAPELIYYLALNHIFAQFLDDTTEDDLAKDATGFRDSQIWRMLYDFQKDAALAIINKLETYNGCILADSVGLGKTFTALAVIEYFERRNRNVLVLCPKKLRDNWMTYNTNSTNNPISGDRLRYDVLYHTDLGRTHGPSNLGIDLAQLNWSNYDLVVIDESHGFRNGGDSSSKANGGMNRYERLLDKVIRDGVPTKVLMLTATPVNNRFRDLQNQLRLAYEGNDDDWEAKLGLSTDIDTVFRNAQTAYGNWAKLPAEERTTQNLVNDLDFDFFKVLDQVTIARSRKHIRNFYDIGAIGNFPQRMAPVTLRPHLSNDPDAATYDAIYDLLDQLKLAYYMPSLYRLTETPLGSATDAPDYFADPDDADADDIDANGADSGDVDSLGIDSESTATASQTGKRPDSSRSTEGLTSEGRERGLCKLMATNLLKRIESSVDAFRLTLDRIRDAMDDQIKQIDAFQAALQDSSAATRAAAHGMQPLARSRVIDWDTFDLDLDDSEEAEEAEVAEESTIPVDSNTPNADVGTAPSTLTVPAGSVDLTNLDLISWRRDIGQDIDIIDALLTLTAPITADKDAKLQTLLDTIARKQREPINPGNRKVLVFTAFADTADYLYRNVSEWAQQRGMEVAEITGTHAGHCTLKDVGGDMGDILACFSPVSKERDLTKPYLKGHDVDILIATDCISEGQNLQDCDMVVNYDIHWNPVRIIQRFGRVDRIGSHNARIQLVNFWPDVTLDKYLRLKDRVEARMKASILTATGDDNYIDPSEKGDLAYREHQLEQMQTEIPDIEDINGTVSITDLGLAEFRMDLVEYRKQNPDIDHVPTGIDAVVEGEAPGILFLLRNTNSDVNKEGLNRIHPYYLVYVRDDGTVEHGHLEPKACLDVMRKLCRGKSAPDMTLCTAYNRETNDGADMRHASQLLDKAVASIMHSDEAATADSLFSPAPATFLDEGVRGLDDFELICFLVVRPYA